MNFINACDRFRASHDGTDSYVELEQSLSALMESDNAHAAVYFTLQQFAVSYVQLYADQAISPEFAARAKREMQRYLDIAYPVFAHSGSPEAMLAALNEIVSTYFHSKKIF